MRKASLEKKDFRQVFFSLNVDYVALALLLSLLTAAVAALLWDVTSIMSLIIHFSNRKFPIADFSSHAHANSHFFELTLLSICLWHKSRTHPQKDENSLFTISMTDCLYEFYSHHITRLAFHCGRGGSSSIFKYKFPHSQIWHIHTLFAMPCVHLKIHLYLLNTRDSFRYGEWEEKTQYLKK